MRKRNVIKQKIDALNLALKKVEEQEKMKVGELVIRQYKNNDLDIDKLKRGIAKILGDEITSSGEIKHHSEAIVETEIRG
mgnify:CR=1 FL=1